MQSKFYLILFGLSLSLNLASQNFTTMTMETWVVPIESPGTGHPTGSD